VTVEGDWVVADGESNGGKSAIGVASYKSAKRFLDSYVAVNYEPRMSWGGHPRFFFCAQPKQ